MKKLFAPLITFILALTGAAQGQEAESTYALQSVQTGKNLRPHGANGTTATPSSSTTTRAGSA